MIGNILLWLVFVLATIGFVWLVVRSWRSNRALLKWLGVVLGGLLTLIFALVSVVIANGLCIIYMPKSSPVPQIKITGTAEQIARGQHLATTLCVSCHSANGALPLSGGRDVAADSPMPIGRLYSINLTPGGPLKTWTDGEILRTMREGIDRDGRPLLVMSANAVRYLSDDDKFAVIAYLRNQPSITNNIPEPPDQPNLLLAFLVSAGLVKIEPPVGSIPSIPKAATVEYGKYVVDYSDCRICHGADLTGGTSPVAPPGPSLRVVQGWTLDQFITTIRTGKDPTGHTLSEAMPWKDIGKLDDVELGAIYTYLKSLPPVQK